MSTNATHAEPLIVPIGHYVGAYFPTPGSQDHHQQVRIGADVRNLDPEQFRVWGLAHGLLDRIDADSAPWTRSALLAAAAEAGVTGAEQVTEALLADGTLVEVSPRNASEFARTHRMVPLMLGLGNTPEEPWLYAVGFPDQPIVKMVSVLYDLWEWTHMDNDIWTACHGAGTMATRAGVTDPDQTDPEKLLSGLVESLHTLLGPNAVYLDLRRAS
jgi:hypothetical protein